MTVAHVTALRPQVEERLRIADARRLAALMGTFEDDRLRLSRMLRTLYPGVERERQLALLRNFRTEVNRALHDLDLDVRFVVDSRKRSDPEQRWCWFEGNVGEPLLTHFTQNEARISDPTRSVEPRATLTPPRRPVRYAFVCAEEDEPAAAELVKLLRTRMLGSRAIAFDGWTPSDLCAGQDRVAERQRHEDASQVLIAFVSPSLLADGPALDRIARLRGEERLLLPMPLVAVDPHRQGLGPFQGIESCPKTTRAFRELRGRAAKEEFALRAWQAIEDAVQRAALPASHHAPSEVAVSSFLDIRAREVLQLPKYSVAARGRISRIHLKGGPDTAVERDLAHGSVESTPVKGNAVDAVSYLQAWAGDVSAPPFFALLGETGMGKTTACRLLALRMLEARSSDPTSSLPIYLDLRRYSWDGMADFSLVSILDAVLRKSLHAGTTPPPSPSDVIHHVQHQGAVVIFDGLDEVIVHMPPKLAQDFIRELWRILPSAGQDGQLDPAGRPGKLLLSCRSHYFRRVWEQNSMLCGEEHEGLRSSDYPALVLLPFEPDQVEEYLRHSVSGLNVDRALELIRSVHNLSELAERPFTLSLIGEFLPDLERRIRSGAEIHAVDLYEAMVTRWLLRDQGKHQFNTPHKELLMESLAAALWASERREWSCEQLEDWLDDMLSNDRRLQVYRGREREVLKEDLRTATFLVRSGVEAFRFAHTSLQEYFLARYLHRALRDGSEDRWVVPMPSDESFDFLCQLLIRDMEERGACERTLMAILGQYRPLASEAALRLWLRSRIEWPGLRRPRRVDLRGAKLAGWQLSGSSVGPLDLRSLDLREADLRGTTFVRADLSGADLAGARACRAEFHDVTATALRFDSDNGDGTDLTGSLWRSCRIADVNLGTAMLDGSRFIRCDFSGVSWPAIDPVSILAGCRDDTGERSTLSRSTVARIDMFTGHTGWVTACAVSPDGRRVVSGSTDRTLRVWDATNGEVLLILAGHRDLVSACAVSPDGRRVLSGSHDGTLRVWDASSGEVLLTLDDHEGEVWACTVSPDGRRFVSASGDGTLRVWHATSGEVLLTLAGHAGGVTACAVSPDGRRIISASEDGTLRVWDATNGEVLLRLANHAGGVTACAVSPDGHRIVSASGDGPLLVWDATSGDVLLTLAGHGEYVGACSVTPDGRRIVSASDDLTLRVWDAVSGEALLTLAGHGDHVRACAVSPNGQRIVSGAFDHSLRVWDATTGENMLTFAGHSAAIGTCVLSPEGRRIVGAADDGTLRVWDACSGQTLLTLVGHDHYVAVCAVTPDGRRIVSGSDDRTLRVWDATSGKILLTLAGHTDWVRACAVTPDGRRIVSGSDDGTLRVWDASSGKVLLTLAGHTDWVMACVVTPDGRRIVSGSADGSLRVWDAIDGEALMTLGGRGTKVTACVVSPDGRRIVSGSNDGRVCVWDAMSGEPLLTLVGHGHYVGACAVTPDGRRIVSGADDSTVRVWDASSGEVLLTLAGHRDWVRSCVVSPDGRRIVSSSDDGTVRVWDATSGAPVLTIARFDRGEEAVFDEVPCRRLRLATSGAWRSLGWLAPDATGFLQRYPAESFGPLPGAGH